MAEKFGMNPEDVHPPYLPDVDARDVTVVEEGKQFVRVFVDKRRVEGAFLMRVEDCERLRGNPDALKDLFTLPTVPKFFNIVTLPAGTRLRAGIANPHPE